MALKKEYKELTGEDPPRADGGASKKNDKKKPAASGRGGSSGGASELLDKLATQGETVRTLKTAKAEKVCRKYYEVIFLTTM